MWIKAIAILLAGLFLSVSLSKCNQNAGLNLTDCVDGWTAAYRQEVGEDVVVTMDQVREWKDWCQAGKQAPTK